MTQPQRPGPTGGFNWGTLSTGSKILMVASLLFIIALFLPGWESYDLGFGDLGNAFGVDSSYSPNAFGAAAGVSWLAFLLALGALVWEALIAFGVRINAGTMSPALIGAILGGAAALFGLITFLMSLGNVSWAAFVGLILALALAYGAYMRFQESKVGPR